MSNYIVGMRFALIGLFLAIVSLATGCYSMPAPTNVAPVVTPDYLADRSVALVEDDGDEVDAYCSGVWVNDTLIATALHCVKDVKAGETVSYVVRSDLAPGGKSHGTVVMARDVEHDLAILKTVGKVPSHKWATIAVDEPQQGQMVQTMGSPLGLMFSYSHGDVAAVRYLSAVGRVDKMLFVQTTAPISPGNSGGALFNAWGEVVGIAHAHYNGSQNLNIFIHYSYLTELLKST